LGFKKHTRARARFWATTRARARGGQRAVWVVKKPFFISQILQLLFKGERKGKGKKPGVFPRVFWEPKGGKKPPNSK